MNEIRLTERDRGYPESLRRLADAPTALHLLGARAGELASGSPWPAAVAIVGARDATAYGLAVARDLGRRLAEAGVVVLSGLAVGIDAAAHRGALDAGGTTFAVIGCGTDVDYPRTNARLRAEILATGLVLGEQAPGTPALAHHFPARNRILSALSLGVVVVEATHRSGSLSTARHALEQGREVFAVPGPVTSPRSRGPHWLLKQGARLVEGVEDVLGELPGVSGPGPGGRAGGLSEPCVKILEAISEGASSVDAIALRLGREVPGILRDLLDLEVRGEVLRGPAGSLARASSAGGPAGGQD
ncbi:DNA-processing protein DprA [bacterium]|nr:DNA-processing protein DprA [bacterium]